jgi:hypothetical protein
VADGEVRALWRSTGFTKRDHVSHRILIIVFVGNVYSAEKNSLLDLHDIVDYRKKGNGCEMLNNVHEHCVFRFYRCGLADRADWPGFSWVLLCVHFICAFYLPISSD